MFFKKKINKYYRKPDINMNELISKEIENYKSPNGKFSIILSHFQEPLNTIVISYFCLTDRFGKILEKFEYLISYSIPELIHWSPNSFFFTVPMYNIDSILIYSLTNRKICTIPVEEVYKTKIKLETDSILFYFDDDSAINFENSEFYPTKNFIIPDPIRIEFNRLKWFDVKDYTNLIEHTKNQEKIKFSLKYIGFKEFNGINPQSTDIEIYKIKRFAEYGHTPSIEWINNLNKNWGCDYYDWEKISKYIR
jgi:hypothetical protein